MWASVPAGRAETAIVRYRPSFAVSRQGDLTFVPQLDASFETIPVWVDRQGQEAVIGADSAYYIAPRISPDGHRIATIKLQDVNAVGEIWVLNADGSQGFPLAAEGADYNPVWTSDGTAVTYTSNGEIFERHVDRDDARRQLLSRANYQLPRDWSPDGQDLAFTEMSSSGVHIWILSDDGEPEPLLSSSFNSVSPRFAPQGGWIAYTSDESGQEEVYVRRYPGSDRSVQISRRGGNEPVWSRDGAELFYRSGNRMMAVEVATQPELQLGDPVLLWEKPYFSQDVFGSNYDVSADGRFLMLGLPDRSETEGVRINVVLDWLAEVESRIAAGS